MKYREVAYKQCFHGFTDVERGHVIRACYGDAINRELNAHFGIKMVRVAPGRVVAFKPHVDPREFRSLVFGLSAQHAHGDDTAKSPAIVDHPCTLLDVERLYPLAFERIAKHDGRPFSDLESKPQPLFGQMVEMLSIRPYRFLLEDAFGEILTVNCCGDVGRGKKKRPPNPEQEPEEEKDAEDKDETLFAFRRTRTFQLQMQEPYLADC
jgi:hypothetical protein